MYLITAYLEAGLLHCFEADTIEKSREIANRIITQGLWVRLSDDEELYYPSNRIYKVKIKKTEVSAGK